MTLVINNPVKPGLHALIAGVSAYRHLPGGAGPLASSDYRLPQLSSAALTAYKIYRWLYKWQEKLEVKVATCQLLLSPSEIEKDVIEKDVEFGLRGPIDPCTRVKFEQAAYDWREYARLNKEDITFFYFAGHGIQISGSNQVLLLEDFANPRQPLLNNTMTTKNLYEGMASSPSRRDIARTQLYFIDACRAVEPEKFGDLELDIPPPVLEVGKNRKGDRLAPIVYAAVPGDKAYALRGEETFFGKALLDCLNGDAGECREFEDQARWYVSVKTLCDRLWLSYNMLNQRPDLQKEKIRLDFDIDHYKPDEKIIHYLDGPPLVKIDVKVDPVEALEYAIVEVLDAYGRKVEVLDDHNHKISVLPKPLQPHPYQCRLPAGTYRINTKIKPRHKPFGDYLGPYGQVRPPHLEWKAKVKV